MARCETSSGEIITARVDLSGITKGKKYEVLSIHLKDNLVWIINDFGKKESYCEDNFN